jgi:hypothetical protein
MYLSKNSTSPLFSAEVHGGAKGRAISMLCANANAFCEGVWPCAHTQSGPGGGIL